MPHGNVLKSPFVYLTIVPFIWSTNYVMGKVIVKDIPPMTITAIRFTIAAILLAVLLKYQEKGFPKPEKKHYFPLLLMGISGVLGFNSLLYAGLRYTTSTNGAIISGFYPALTAILSVVFIREDFNFYKVAGLIFSLAGVLLITVHASWREMIAFHFNPGDLLVFLATASWAVYSVAGKFVMGSLSPLCVTTYSCLLGLIFLYPGMIMELRRGAGVALSWPSVLILLYIGIAASVVAHFLWNRGVQEIGPAKTSYFYNLLPLFTAVLANIFLNEHIYWYHLAGGAAVIFGVYLGTCSASSGEPSKLCKI